MYQELIEKLNPKPKFNLKWYKDEDLYSEGEIEDAIIKMIAENEPEDYVGAIYDNFNWSTYYHLTHIRKNILNWYPFEADSSVLEIGCGLGAITSVLCDNCKDVTAVELSQKRAMGALLRCREKDNLEIIVGNLNDIEFEKKFDYITLIGVLEYQGSYTETETPYQDFLKKIKGLLKPNGKLLIAIENQYGLKYWCGAREDHTSVPFEGMNQYHITNRKVRTFSKSGLEKLVKDSGFKNTYFYYPMPDYKLPTVIYSEKCLPQNENMQNMACYYAPDKSTLVADEKAIYKDVIENGVFEFFSNSFLVECSDSNEIGKVTFASISGERLRKYCVGTRFVGKSRVEKFALSNQKGLQHLAQIVQNEKALEKKGVQVVGSQLENNILKMDYVEGTLLEKMFVEACRNGEKDEAYKIIDMLYEEILKSSEEIGWEENILYSLEFGIEPDSEKYGPILKIGYLDMILRNAFYEDGKITWFDQEWILESVPAKYVLYRALMEVYYSFPDISENVPVNELAARYEMSAVWEEFGKLDTLFSGSVMDQKHWGERSVFTGADRNVFISNIKKILNI